MLDTNVIVSGYLFEESKPGQVLIEVLERGTLLLSREVSEELIEVLGRRKFDRYVKQETRARFLANLFQQAEYIEIKQPVHECRDPGDDKFLELALNGSADVIVSGDDDLLVLAEIRGIPIRTPDEFLSSLPRHT